MTYTISKNAQYGSIEIAFDEKPSEAVRTALKGIRFRWNGIKKIWFGYTDEDTARKVIEGAESGEAVTSERPKAAKANKYGVKVGDIFSASWGYEQTNVDFFQVVEVVGSQSVRVREVHLPMTDERAVSGMSADRTYKITNEILPPAPHSVFIEDQERGDVKRLKSYHADGVSNPQFRLSSFADAHKVTGDSIKTYESWYY